MNDMERIAAELYVPATDAQLRGFADTLQVVANKVLAFSGGDYQAEFEFTIGTDEENQKVRFFYERDPDTQSRRFYLNTISTMSIDGEWSREAAAMLLGYQHLGEDDDNDDDDTPSDDESEGVTEGYVQHDVQLTVVRAARSIDASKAVMYNVLDDSGDGIDAHYVCMRGTEDAVDEVSSQDLELLYEKGIATLDARFHEQMLSLVTPVDLISGAFALTSVGMLDKRKIAYPGAPTYLDVSMLLPRLFT